MPRLLSAHSTVWPVNVVVGTSGNRVVVVEYGGFTVHIFYGDLT